jgi:hypothetical protein
MHKKHAVALLGIIVGLSWAAAADWWPDRAAVIEIVLYSVLIFGLMVIGFWSDRKSFRYATGMSIVVLLHGSLVYFSRSLFPFRTFFAIVPLAMAEVVVLYIFMTKILDRTPKSPSSRSTFER